MANKIEVPKYKNLMGKQDSVCNTALLNQCNYAANFADRAMLFYVWTTGYCSIGNNLISEEERGKTEQGQSQPSFSGEHTFKGAITHVEVLSCGNTAQGDINTVAIVSCKSGTANVNNVLSLLLMSQFSSG